MRRLILFVGCMIFLSRSTTAQQHAAMPITSHPVLVAPPSRVPSVISAAAAQLSTGVRSAPRPAGIPGHAIDTSTNATNRPIPARHAGRGQDALADDFPVPGLGFDAVHFAATHQQGSRHRPHGFEFFLPFFGGGSYVSFLPVSEEVAPAEPPPAESPQVEESESATTVRRGEPFLAPASPATGAAAPQQQEEEFIFVRRDGTVFFAIAFSWDQETLRFITREGLRQSVTRAALDLDATRQFNEQRGLSFRSPS
jgi:hypothetical protein